MSLSPGTRIGQYEVRAPLGAGGMGEVYRAHDARLGRDVALKVLHPEVARDAVRLERFAREARAVAALNHPHIVTIYSTEEADGIRFMTMELVEGRPLDELIPRAGLPVTRFLELALPLADALTAAHQKQITHRDLKPGNVMVASDGRVKVLDFGLARVATAAPEQAMDATRAVLTHEGTIVGTMPYMSPEQVEGRALDARSDLFSLGVMFYEMLTGSRPFAGPSSPALMSAILRDVPPPVTERRSDVPDTLARLIARCLEKHPEERVQTARDVHNELRHVQKQLESGAGRRSGSGAPSGTEASLWMAVLPFGARSADADSEALAAGLTEDITGGLSRFPALSVIAPQSAAAFRNSPLDVRQIAERLGARYVLGGTVRKSASAVRIAAHLVDAHNGAHLWTDTYDQRLDGTDLFTIQDDVTDRIVATIADKAGVLARSMVQALRQLPMEQLSARELIFRCWMFQWQPMPEVQAEVRRALEHHLEARSDNPHLWAELANIYICEHSLFFNPLPDALGRAMRAARRAIEIDPGNQEGWEMVALTSFYLKDEAGMIEAADRAIRLNPRNSNALAWMGNIRTHAGDYDRGSELTGRAMTLNPAHPGWYHFAPFNRHFARGEYDEALKAARRVNMPEFMWMHFAVAAAAGQLGLGSEAKKAAEAMVALAPSFADEASLREFVTRWYWPTDLIECLLDGVARALSAEGSDAAVPSRSSSAEAGQATGRPRSGLAADRDRSIAVVPFAAASGDPDTQALTDGLTEDITAGLSRFPYLSVVAAHSARQYRGSTADVRRLGEALGARYLLDGNARRVGAALRLTVRLVDTASGAQLWSETYNRAGTNADRLALQDDLTDRIVATVADAHGVLLRAMSQGVEQLSADQLGPDALALRYWAYHRQHAPAQHALLRDAFERLVEERPASAFAWSALAHLYCHEHGFRFNARPDPLVRARRALGRALELDAVDQHGWEALALAYFFERDAEGFAHAAERAIALNPRNANTLAWIGVLTVHAGELDRGCTLVERAMALNPDHPGWYHIAMSNRHLVRGEHAEALRAAKRINMPQHVWAHVVVAIAAGELGRMAEAAAAVDAVEQLAPAMADPAVVAEATRNWKWDDAAAGQMLVGYRKAVALREDAKARSRPPSSGPTTSRASSPAAATSDSSRWAISVNDFGASGGPQATALAAGLTEDIATGLSRFGNLKVLARNARYVLSGSVRQSGEALRVTARVIDTASGANIWADTYDRTTEGGVFALQDDVGSRIVSTVADPTGVLGTAMATAIGDKDYESLSVQELVIRFHVYTGQLRPGEHARLREAFERALEREPDVAEGWASLAYLYGQEHALGLNPQPDSRERERRAAERAVELDPQSPLAWTALARSHMFAHDATATRAAVDRALALNPLNADLLGHAAIFLTSFGDFDRALALVARATELKPRHQGWFYFPVFNAHYVRGDDHAALEAAKKINMPAVSLAAMAAAAAAGQLGRTDEARASLDTLRQHAPHLLDPVAARGEWSIWLWSEALLDRLVEGFEKSLALTGAAAGESGHGSGDRHAASPAALGSRASFANGTGAPATSPQITGALQSADDLSLAVQPFSARGGDATAVALAEALTDDVTTGLSRFEHLRVMASAGAQRVIAPREGPWRYALEGTVRTAGRAVRVGVRISDAHTGANVWAENFDLDSDSGVFTQQDDLASRIVATVGDPTGALAKAMRAALSDTPIEQLSAEGLMLLYHGYTEHLRAEDHARLRQALEQAVERQPQSHLGWAILSRLYEHEHAHRLNVRPDSIARQRNAAYRALELDSASQSVWVAVASAHKFSGDMPALHGAVERAVAINPLNADALAFCALLISTGGADERALQLARLAMHHKPRHPGWYHFPTFNALYVQGQDEEALAEARLINMPKLALTHRSSAAAAGQLGRAHDARLALDALAAIDATLLDPARARTAWRVWVMDGPLLDRLVEGFGKALALAGESPASRPLSSGTADRASHPASTSSELRVAVLPFTARGGEFATGLADGLGDDITTGLSRFPHLRIVPAASAAALTPESAPRAGVRYLLEGRVQERGAAVRVTVRLIDGSTGVNLWAETFDRPIGPTAFEVQDDIASYVVATVGDTSGVLARSMGAPLLQRPVEELNVRELVLRFHAYVEHFQADEHARLRSGLERALEREPHVAEGWARLANLYGHEYSQGRNPLPDSLGRQRRAAQRALQIDPHNQAGWTGMVAVHMFERDRTALRAAAERAIALNPLDADTVGLCALYLSCAGDDDRAMELFERAVRVKPQHPGWYHFAPFTTHFKRREYADALAEVKRINMPQLPTMHISAAAAAARVGSAPEAQAAVEALRRLDARFLESEAARQAVALWIWDEAHVNNLVDGLAEAIALSGIRSDTSGAASALTAGGQGPGASLGERPRSGSMPLAAAARDDSGLRVAVLPFTARGGEEVTALAEGLTDEITTALARFPYLKVVSRAAVAALDGPVQEAPAAGVRLGARFLLEGSVRKAGSALRVSVRLSDVESGAHLWAETFDREAASGIFALQDDLSACITSQVADPSGALVRSMAATRAHVPLDQMTTAELTLQFFAHLETFDAARHAALRDAFEHALEREPSDATAWGCLSDLYMQEFAPGLNPRPDSLGRQRAAAERAVALDATCQYGWLGLAMHRLFAGDHTGATQAAERAVALNPLNSHVVGLVGNAITALGDWDRGLGLVRRALSLNPHIAGHVHLALFLDSYRRGDDEAALASAKRFNIPTLSMGHLSQAAAAGQLGCVDDARAALDALYRIDPALCEAPAAHEAYARILRDAALVQRLTEGFEKALALVAPPPEPRPGGSVAVAARSGPPAPPLRDNSRAPSDSGTSGPASDASGAGLGRGTVLSVAVQPFTARADDAEAGEVARGLTDNVTTGLSRFRYVRVRSITTADEGQDPRRAGAAAGTSYVLDGAVRRSGSMFRVSARLTEVATGEHWWAEQYDREASSTLFVLQDDLASRIVATLADGGGLLGRALADVLRDADPRSAGLFAAWSGYVEHFTPDRHAALRDGLESLVAQQPDTATEWAYLSILYGHEVFFDFNPRPDPVSRVRRAAERAVTLEPDNQTAWYAMAGAEFFDRHDAAFRSAAERAIELNPLHSRTLGGLGIFNAFAGDTDRGAALAARAMSLNPRFPGWFHIVPFLDAYRRGDADAAFTHAARINMPHLPVGGRLFAVAAAGRFGREREARDGIRLVGESRPDLLSAAAARHEWSRWIWEGELLEVLVDGYAAALVLEPGTSTRTAARPQPARPASGNEAQTLEGGAAALPLSADAAMRLAVLPFSARGGGDSAVLADGLTDDITTALARFPYLLVVSRATVRELDGTRAAVEAGSRLGARFLLEGAVREASGRVRVSAHLSDAQSGAHLWADTYDRDFGGGIFAAQDDIVSRIAATVADAGGVLVRTIASRVRDRRIEDLDADELVLRYHGDFVEHFDAADHAQLRDAFEAVVAREPGTATAWACLAMIHALEIFFDVNPKPDPLARLRRAAERANTLDPTIQHGWVAMATAALFDRDRAALQAATDRALALNPCHTRSLATLGLFTAFSGDTTRGMQLMDRSLSLNPRHPGWYLLAPFLHEYERGNFNAALGYARRIGMPKFVAGNLAAAAAAGQVGTVEDARPALDALARFDPALLETEAARGVWARWLWNADVVDRLVEGLEKAVALVPGSARPPGGSA